MAGRRRDVRAGLSAPGRGFGVPVGAVLLALAAVAAWRGVDAVAAGLVVTGGLLFGLGVVAPGLLVPVERRWMRFAHALSRITNPVVMAVIYLLVITPIGLAFRLLKGNPVLRRSAESYWIPRERDAGRRGDLTRQF